MNRLALRSLPHQFAAALGIAVSALLLGSCGGGGAASAPIGGAPSVAPLNGTAYAGIPYTLTLTGGRRPYTMTSSEQTLFPLPQSVDATTVAVAPGNPGVIDAGLEPGEVPRRTVNISLRDANGDNAAPATVRVLQNFLTGYGASFVSNCPTPTGGAAAPQACAGGETIITVTPVSAGLLFGNRVLRMEVVRGDFRFLVPESPSNPPGTLSNTCTTNTDHTGTAICRIVVATNAVSQLATVRIIDVATGVYVDEVFAINGVDTSTALVALPDTITFTGTLGRCGIGAADFFVFDGTPPYTAATSNGNVSVSPTTSNENPGRFTVTAGNQAFCGTVPIVVTDSVGRRTTVTVTTATGGTAPALAVSPATITLGCGATGSASVVGGSGSYSVTSTHPRVTATVSGNTVSITRLGGDAAAVPPAPPPPHPTTATINVTDGNTIQAITVTVPATCP